MNEEYKIDYDGMEFCFEDPVTSAVPGELVRACFSLIATDTNYEFDVVGADGWSYDAGQGGGINIKFTMPANDVTVKVSSYNSMANPVR